MKYFWMSAYVGSILLANIFLNSFITLPFFILSIGTIFFGFIFTIRDRLHQYGLNFVFISISIALLINLLYSIIYNTEIRFIIASFLAILLSELSDTVIFHRYKTKSWILRVISSNSISIPLDSVIFALIAFLGILPLNEIIQIIYTDITIKFIVAMLIIYPMPKIKDYLNTNKQII